MLFINTQRHSVIWDYMFYLLSSIAVIGHWLFTKSKLKYIMKKIQEW